MRRYLSLRAVGLHLILVVLLPVFSWLTWWQLGRALDGNTLSWAYTFEWPLFAGYALYVWWQLVHDQSTAVSRALDRAPAGGGSDPEGHDQPGWALSGGRRRSVAVAAGSAVDGGTGRGERFAPQTPEEAARLAEYNRYLGQLHSDSEPGQLHSDSEPGQLHADSEPGQLHADSEPGKLHADSQPGNR